MIQGEHSCDYFLPLVGQSSDPVRTCEITQVQERSCSLMLKLFSKDSFLYIIIFLSVFCCSCHAQTSFYFIFPDRAWIGDIVKRKAFLFCDFVCTFHRLCVCHNRCSNVQYWDNENMTINMGKNEIFQTIRKSFGKHDQVFEMQAVSCGTLIALRFQKLKHVP